MDANEQFATFRQKIAPFLRLLPEGAFGSGSRMRQCLRVVKHEQWGDIPIYLGADERGRIPVSVVHRVLGLTDNELMAVGQISQSDIVNAARVVMRAHLLLEGFDCAESCMWLPLVRTEEGELLLDPFLLAYYMGWVCKWFTRLAASEASFRQFAADFTGAANFLPVQLITEHFNSTFSNKARSAGGSYKIAQWVYFLRDPNKRIKIGISANPHQRMKGMRTDNPEKLELLGVIPNATEETERAMHLKFAHLRLSGEWFRECEELLSYIEGNAEKMPPPEPKRRRQAKV